MALNPLKGVAQGIAGRALKTVAGNITDGLLGKNDKGGDGFSDYRGAIGKYSTKHLSFPIDVEAPPGLGNQGHYVIFEINKQKPPKLTLFDRQQAANEGRINLNKAKKQQGGTNIDTLYSNLPPHEKSRTTKEQFAKQRSDAETNRYLKQLEQRQTTVGIKRRKTVTLDTHISLYMPPQVSVSYKSDYEEVEIGRTAEKAFDMLRSGDPSVGAALGVMKAGVKDAVMSSAAKLMGELQGAIPGTEGAIEAAQIGVGKVMSKKMEVMFKGVGRRTFSYTFAFIPKSETESQMVDKIVYQLKRAMLPSYVQGGFGGITDEDRTLKIPNTMDIEYFYAPPNSNSTQRNNYLNKIATCYLTDMSVSYGGDRYKAYRPSETIRGAGDGEGTPPQRTSVTLNFTEIEIITQEDVDLGY